MRSAPKEIEVDLLVDLTPEEVQEPAQQLSSTITEYDQCESAKRDAMKAYSEELQSLRGRMKALSKVIRDKAELRIVHCLVELDTPIPGHKRLVRLDTGEVVCEKLMTDDDRQQPMFPESKSKPN